MKKLLSIWFLVFLSLGLYAQRHGKIEYIRMDSALMSKAFGTTIDTLIQKYEDGTYYYRLVRNPVDSTDAVNLRTLQDTLSLYVLYSDTVSTIATKYDLDTLTVSLYDSISVHTVRYYAVLDSLFIWKNDTIQKDSLSYIEWHGDSVRFKRIGGLWGKWIVCTTSGNQQTLYGSAAYANIDQLVTQREYACRFEAELTVDAQNNIYVGFILTSSSDIFYNGEKISSSQWTGLGTNIITLILDTRKYDKLIID